MNLKNIKYTQGTENYFKQRILKRYAGVWSLWALGVGAVISGDFFGWNFGLASGGFGGLFIATVIIAIMYIGMCYSIAEMSPALPHTGGAYSFSRTAMGPMGGFITGLAENMEYVLTPAVIVVGIGGYMGTVFNDLFGINISAPLWWLLAYFIFVGLNIIGVELTFRFTVFITFLALGILLVFWIGALPHFSWEHALNIKPDPGQTTWLPKGWGGIAKALPFAIWFYLAIEQLPLAAEESHDPKKDMPKGLLWGILTLIIASFLTLFLNAGIAPGSAEVGTSAEPLFLAFKTIFGDGIGSSLLALVAVAGLIASFHTIIYAYGRNIFSLSRAGYFPKWLSITHSKRNTPYIALIVGAIIGYVVALIIEFGETFFGSVPVGAVLLNMAVFGAVIAYIMQMAAFVLLRKNHSDIERPYLSPLGNAGAIIAGLIAAVTLVFLFLNPDYVVGVYGCAIWFLGGILYFWIYARHSMILSPEEEFALKSQEKVKG
ncbi:MAG: ethanolamine permease [Calditrichaeota bacterium]|nr:MAG: ethanolamine permease [Calditrichota bacterium]MBL1207667.1 ethanolamine permease [Calditrichota bacterium]NOG47500.1 ethanolamine permease [Calditrichota bacterium]